MMGSHGLRCVALVAASVVCLASAGSAQERPQDRPGFLDNIFNRGEQGGGQRVAQADDSEMAVRLDRLENQLRQITGALEQLQYRNQQLEQQLKRVQEDSEYRFQQLGSRGGAPVAQAPAVAAVPRGPQAPTAARGVPQALTPSQSAPQTPATGRRSDVFDPSQNPTAPGAPRALGGGSVATLPANEEPAGAAIGAPGGRAPGAPLDLSTLSDNSPPAENGALPPPPARNTSATGTRLATLPPSASPKDEYDLAYGYVLHKDYALAEQAFRDFIRKYPGDRQASEANYWLGETLFQRQRYQDAADAFLVVVRNHEKSGKAPEALLRLGQSLAALGQKEMACASLAEVERKYPRASAGVKKNVVQEQKRAHC